MTDNLSVIGHNYYKLALQITNCIYEDKRKQKFLESQLIKIKKKIILCN